MNRIEWSEEWSVGVHVLDEEHKRIIDVINELELIIPCKNTDERLTICMSKIAHYISKHFYHEEHILQANNYPDLKDHLIQHIYFKRAIADFHMMLLEQERMVGFELLRFLRDWFVDHILREDKAYTPFVKNIYNEGRTDVVD